jgi:hypothetical protein
VRAQQTQPQSTGNQNTKHVCIFNAAITHT